MPKKIVFVTGTFLPKDALARQICKTVQAAFKPDTDWSVVRRNYRRRADHLYVSLQPNVPGDVLLGFDLADRRHYHQSDANGDRLVSAFRNILVPGRWTHQQLLNTESLELDPAQLMITGAPRVDYLRTQPQPVRAPGSRTKVVFAPLHKNWRDNSGAPLSIADDFAPHIPLLKDICDVTTVTDPRNTYKKVPITAALLEADIVITDYTSLIYEAWALGKPVIMPRWLTGDRVIDKTSWIAESVIYSKRIGHHPSSFEDMRQLILQGRDLPLGEGVQTFMLDYVANYDGNTHAGRRVAQALEHLSDPTQVALEAELIAQGQTELATRNYTVAKQSFSQAIALSDFDFRPFQGLAHIHRQGGDLQSEAEMMIAMLDRHDPGPQDEWRLSEVLKSLGQTHLSVRQYHHDARAGGEEAWVWHYDLGRIYQDEGALDQAAYFFTSACALSDDPDAHMFGVGCLHIKQGYWRDAQSALTDRLEDQPSHARLHYLAGWSFDRNYSWAQAEAHYRQAIALSPIQWDCHARLGFVLERQGRLQEAAAAYLFAAENGHDKTNENAYHAGYVLEQAGNVSLAVEAYQKMMPQRGHGSSNVTHLLEAYRNEVTNSHLGNESTKNGYLSPAQTLAHDLALLEADMAIDCTDPAHWRTLSTFKERNGDVQGAADAMQQALWRSNTHQTDWYDRHGYLLNQLGLQVEACAAFRQRYIFQRHHGTTEEKRLLNDKALRKSVVYREFYETLPIVPNTILYESFGGEGISDNPLAMYQQIITDARFKGWRHIWVIDDLKKIPDHMRSDPNIFFVAKETELYHRFLCTVAYLINNATFPYYFVRKDGQEYLNTWHGTPLKTLGYDITTTPLQRANTARNLIQSSLFIAPNRHTEEIMLDRYGVRQVFSGRSLLTGYPRIDATLNATEDDKRQMLGDLGLDPDKPVVLFAPTYRGHWSTPELEAGEMAATLDRLKSADYNLIFRGHYFAEKTIMQMNLPVTIAPHAIDTCKLLSIVDVLVSDYSSIFYDFLVTQRPVIHYVYDWDRYVETRGVYFGKEDLPGAVCEDVVSLLHAVAEAIRDPKGQISATYQHARETYCALDDGHASERVVNALFFDQTRAPDPSQQQANKRLLIYAGDLDSTETTQAARDLLKITHAHGWTNVVMADRRMLINDHGRTVRAQDLLDRGDVLIRFGRACFSLEEMWLRRIEKTDDGLSCAEMAELANNGLRHEIRRLLGDTAFDLVLDFSGKRSFWSQLLAHVNAKHHTIRVTDNLPRSKDSLNGYDVMFGQSQKMARTLKQRMQADYRDARFAVLDDVIDIEATIQLAKADRDTADYKAFSKDRRFKFVCPEKVWSTTARNELLSAIKTLAAAKLKFSVYITCDVLARLTIEPLAEQLGVMSYICFVTRPNIVAPYISGADCVLIASVDMNGHHSIAETLCLSVACIVTGHVPTDPWFTTGGAQVCAQDSQAIAGVMTSALTDKPAAGRLDLAQYETAIIAGLITPNDGDLTV